LPRSRRPLQIDNIASHAVLARFGQTARHNLANLIRIANEIHRLHIGASTSHLTITATGTLDKNINNLASVPLLKANCWRSAIAEGFQAVRILPILEPVFRPWRGCSGARAVFKRIGRCITNLTDKRQRFSKISVALTRETNNEIT
jgi:hypothetical protein